MPEQPAESSRQKPTQKRPSKPPWKPLFLAELERWGVVEYAARQAGVHRSTVYDARATDEKFRAQWDEVEGTLLSRAEVVARQRALTGTQKPVFFQGQQVATVLEVDNAHLRWLLAKLKPELYGDKPAEHIHEHRHNVEGKLDLKALSVDQLRSLRDILTAAVVPGDGERGPAPAGEPATRGDESL